MIETRQAGVHRWWWSRPADACRWWRSRPCSQASVGVNDRDRASQCRWWRSRSGRRMSVLKTEARKVPVGVNDRDQAAGRGDQDSHACGRVSCARTRQQIEKTSRSTSPRPTDPIFLDPSPAVDPASRAGGARAGQDRKCVRCVTITVYPGLLLTLCVSIFTPWLNPVLCRNLQQRPKSSALRRSASSNVASHTPASSRRLGPAYICAAADRPTDGPTDGLLVVRWSTPPNRYPLPGIATVYHSRHVSVLSSSRLCSGRSPRREAAYDARRVCSEC